MAIRIDLKDYNVFIGGIQNNLKTSAVRGVRSAAIRLMNEITLRIVPNIVPEPIDRGLYRSGWKTQSIPNGAIIYNTEEHSAFIEHGVEANNVKISRLMIEALQGWLIRKGFSSKKDSLNNAFGLAVNLKKSGIFNRGKGFHPLQLALDKYAQEFIGEEITNEIAKQFEKLK